MNDTHTVREKKETKRRKKWLNWRSVDMRNILWVPHSHAYINAHVRTLTSAPPENKCDNNQCGGFIYPVKSPCETCCCCWNMQHQFDSCLLRWFFFSRPFEVHIHTIVVPQDGTQERNFMLISREKNSVHLSRAHFICHYNVTGQFFCHRTTLFFSLTEYRNIIYASSHHLFEEEERRRRRRQQHDSCTVTFHVWQLQCNDN